MLSSEDLYNIAKQANIPLPLYMSVYATESSSGTDPRASTPNEYGAVGPFQVTPGTFRDMMGGSGDINNERDNAIAAARYIKQGLDKYGGDQRKASMYYFGGPDESLWGTKTQAYANKVMTYAGHAFESMLPSAALSEDVPQKTSGVPDYERLTALIQGDVNSVVSALQDTQQKSEAYQGQYNAAVANRVKSQSGVSDAYAAIASAIATMQAHRALGVMNTLGSLGIDDESVSNLQATVTTKMSQETEQLLEMRQALRDKANAIPGLTENSIGWLLGSLSIRKDIAEHNNLRGQLNDDKQLLDILTSSADNIQKVNLAKKAAGEASVALAEGALHIAQAQDTTAKIQQDAAEQNQVFATKQVQTKIQTMQAHESQLRILEMSQNKEDQMAARALKQQTDAEALSIKNDALKMVGYAPVPSMEVYNKLPKKQRDVAESIIAAGGMKFGPDTYTAYQNVNAGDPRRMTTDVQAMLKIEGGIVDKVKKDLIGKVPEEVATQGLVFEALKPAEQTQIISNRILKEYDKMQKNPLYNPIPGLQSNPYAAPPIESILNDPKFSTTSLATVLKSTIEQTPALKIDPQYVIARAKAELVAGKLYPGPGSIEKAANDLQSYFEAVKGLNNQSMMFSKWNLPEQNTYFVGEKDYTQRKVITTDLAKSLAFPGQELLKKIISNLPITPSAAAGAAANVAKAAQPIAQGVKNLFVPEYAQTLQKADENAAKNVGAQ